MTIRVLLVDDQPLIRRGLAGIISLTPGFEVVAEAGTGHEGVASALEHHPDVVVMDIRMPDLDGIEATRQICSNPELADVCVLVLTTFEQDEYVLDALRAGASGFLGKGSEPEEIVHAITVVAAREALLSPRATRSLIDRYLTAGGNPASAATNTSGKPTGTGDPLTPDAAHAAAHLNDLTDREREVLVLVGGGFSNAEIAERLTISPHTAKTHVNRIQTKLSAHDRAQLVIAAYEGGLVARRG